MIATSSGWLQQWAAQSSPAARRWRFGLAMLLTVLTGAADWSIGLDISMGVLYVIPATLLATVLTRGQIMAAAVLFAALRVLFGPPRTVLELALGFTLAWVAYTAAGLLVFEMFRTRALTAAHLKEMEQQNRELERQQQLRLEAEEQLRILAESSPAAVMTLDAGGRVLAANQAACDLLGFDEPADVAGVRVGTYLPVLVDALSVSAAPAEFRTAAQCHGRRRSGEPFVAQTWFSTYNSIQGRRLAAIAVDLSEEVRDREESHFAQLQQASRLAVGALAHEVRTLTSAATMLVRSMASDGSAPAAEDITTLERLLTALSRLAGADLGLTHAAATQEADLRGVLDTLRLVVEPLWQEQDGHVVWPALDGLPMVTVDSDGLLQVLLNLAHNSLRAVHNSPDRILTLTTEVQTSCIVLRVHDTGPGIPHPERLFQPFQEGADGTGLGLYLSRAMVRRWGGELRYEAVNRGTCFAVTLLRADHRAQAAS